MTKIADEAIAGHGRRPTFVAKGSACPTSPPVRPGLKLSAVSAASAVDTFDAPSSARMRRGAEQHQVEAAGNGDGDADRRDFENSKTRLPRDRRHVVDQQVGRSADQCAAAAEHCCIGQRHEVALRRLPERLGDVPYDRGAEHHDGRIVEKGRRRSREADEHPEACSSDVLAEESRAPNGLISKPASSIA